ncbi:MAG: DUF11 domain-containing protein, partial [Candidatus Abawacabacteria bacterium]|nr:DUF11 domain-containing protein [Candidatus Abawacabacteria bacterium]
DANDKRVTIEAEIMAGDQGDPSCGGGIYATTNCFGDDTNQGEDWITTVIRPYIRADLSLGLNLTSYSPTAGATMTYTVTLTNNGPVTATNVEVRYTMPASIVYVSDNQGTYNPTTGIWQVDNLATSTSIDLIITVIPLGTDAITTTGEIMIGDQADPDCDADLYAVTNCFGNGASEDGDYGTLTLTPVIDPSSADLAVTMTADDEEPAAGSNVTFTITVTNDGPAEATGVALTNLLPAGLTYVSDTSAGDYDSGTGVWTVGTVPVSDSASFTLTATATTGALVINRVQVTASDQIDPDSVENDDSTTHDDDAAVSINGVAADLRLTTALNDSSIFVNQTTEYTITITNDGPDDASGVTVAVIMSPDLAYISDDSGGDYDQGTGIWMVGSLANGGTESITITVEATDDGDHDLIAEIDAADQIDPDSTPGNLENTEDDYDLVTVSATISADLSLGLVLSPLTAVVDDDGVYTLTVTNDGPSDAANIVVLNPIPATTTFLTANADAGTSYSNTTGEWTITFLASGDTATLEITVNFDSVGEVVNTAEIISADTPDPNSTFGDSADQEDFKSATIEIDSGVTYYGTITGHIFTDENANGVQDSGEADGYDDDDLIVTISDGSTDYSPTIDDNGDYSQVVATGEYTVAVDAGSNVIIRGADNPAMVTVTADTVSDIGAHGIYNRSSGSSHGSSGGGSSGGSSSSSNNRSSSSGWQQGSSNSSSRSTRSSQRSTTNVNTSIISSVNAIQERPLACLELNGAAALDFADVPLSSVEKLDIDFLSSTLLKNSNGTRVVQGNNGVFMGTQLLSRYELTKLVLATNCFNYIADAVPNTFFLDVPKDYSDMSLIVGKAYAANIVQGQGGQFYPHQIVTYGELVKVLIGAARQKGYILNDSVLPIAIEGIGDEGFREFATKAVNTGLIDLLPGNIFPQNKPVSRNEMAQIFVRYLKLLQGAAQQ